MEDKEMQEVYNPQSGEKIVLKKKVFYKEWRFWVWSLIAFMLFVVSLSSLVTACAAINAGVGTDQGTSQVSRERKGAYYSPDYVADYGTSVGYVYNYVCDLKSNETYGNFWYLDNKSADACALGLKANTALEEQYVDVYTDGSYSGTYFLSSDSWMYHPFMGAHFYWLFSNERGFPLFGMVIISLVPLMVLVLVTSIITLRTICMSLAMLFNLLPKISMPVILMLMGLTLILTTIIMMALSSILNCLNRIRP